MAINKIDKAERQPDRVKKELADHGLLPEEWGGDTVMVPVSALKQGRDIDELLEMILLHGRHPRAQGQPRHARRRASCIEAAS